MRRVLIGQGSTSGKPTMADATTEYDIEQKDSIDTAFPDSGATYGVDYHV